MPLSALFKYEIWMGLIFWGAIFLVLEFAVYRRRNDCGSPRRRYILYALFAILILINNIILLIKFG